MNRTERKTAGKLDRNKSGTINKHPGKSTTNVVLRRSGQVSPSMAASNQSNSGSKSGSKMVAGMQTSSFVARCPAATHCSAAQCSSLQAASSASTTKWAPVSKVRCSRRVAGRALISPTCHASLAPTSEGARACASAHGSSCSRPACPRPRP